MPGFAAAAGVTVPPIQMYMFGFAVGPRRPTVPALGLKAVAPAGLLVARRHSAAMAAHARGVGHEGFDDRVLILRRALATRRTGENVALNRGYRDPAAEALRGWIASAGHRRNLEGPYEATGIGVARNPDGELYFTQLFVGY